MTVILNSTVKTLANIITLVPDVTYTIDCAGNIVAVKFVTTISSSELTLTYHSV